MKEPMTLWVEYAEKKMCCAERMVSFGLALREQENATLCNAAAALCGGLHGGYLCGALTGGAMLLSMFDRALAKEVLIPELTEWFDSTFGMKCGSMNCEDIKGDDPNFRTAICGPMMGEVAGKCVELLQKNHLL